MGISKKLAPLAGKSAPALLGVGAFQACLLALDSYSRMELVMRLFPYLKFLGSPLVPLALILSGFASLALVVNTYLKRQPASAHLVKGKKGKPNFLLWNRLLGKPIKAVLVGVAVAIVVTGSAYGYFWSHGLRSDITAMVAYQDSPHGPVGIVIQVVMKNTGRRAAVANYALSVTPAGGVARRFVQPSAIEESIIQMRPEFGGGESYLVSARDSLLSKTSEPFGAKTIPGILLFYIPDCSLQDVLSSGTTLLLYLFL